MQSGGEGAGEGVAGVGLADLGELGGLSCLGGLPGEALARGESAPIDLGNRPRWQVFVLWCECGGVGSGEGPLAVFLQLHALPVHPPQPVLEGMCPGVHERDPHPHLWPTIEQAGDLEDAALGLIDAHAAGSKRKRHV